MRNYIPFILLCFFTLNLAESHWEDLTLPAYPNSTSKKKTVALIINKKIYPEIQERIFRLQDDLSNEGWTVICKNWDAKQYPEPAPLRDKLRELHQKHSIEGAILIGHLPYYKFTGHFVPDLDKLKANEPQEIPYFINAILDSYFYDPYNHTFGLNRNNDIIELNLNPILWVSRISPPSDLSLFPESSEGNLINCYLDKNHRYRAHLSPKRDKVVYFFSCADERVKHSNLFTNYFSTDSSVAYIGKRDTYKDILKRKDIHTLFTGSHSILKNHHFTDYCTKEEINPFASHEITQLPIKPYFLFLNACMASNISENKSLSHAYLFSKKSNILTIIGLTGTEDLDGFRNHNPNLTFDHTIGTEFLKFHEYNINYMGYLNKSKFIYSAIELFTLSTLVLKALHLLPAAFNPIKLRTYNRRITSLIYSFSGSIYSSYLRYKNPPKITCILLGDGTLKQQQ